MIITHIMGGIGNQLFQYAFGRYLAYKNNTELKLDISQCEREKFLHHNYYRLGDFNIAENIATPEDFQKMELFREDGRSFDENFLNLPDNIFLFGYWGDEKYFVDIRDILLREFTLKKPLGDISVYWQTKILSAKNPVSLHVRCGDYLTPQIRYHDVIPLDYYLECVNILKESFSEITLFVFSDDLDYAKKFLKFDVPTNFVEGCEKDCDELYLMSICKHNIVPRSTFSWWGAWLNQNPDKKVFVPSDWGPSESWIKISVDKNENMFPPFVSIIIYVENNLDSMQFTMPSFFNQKYKNYEIIIVDNGTNNFCRQFAADEKVTYLKIDKSVGKFSAWNKGLANARGENVLFMTSKDFIVDNLTGYLAHFFYEYLKNIEPQGKYLNHANYDETFPDIICSTQILSRNISDKNFSVRTDEPFKNLNTAAEINLDYSQKLHLLGTQQINHLLNTKIFKRKFLVEHDIKFENTGNNMNSGGGVKFLINCFLSTDKIVFVPQVFSCTLN